MSRCGSPGSRTARHRAWVDATNSIQTWMACCSQIPKVWRNRNPRVFPSRIPIPFPTTDHQSVHRAYPSRSPSQQGVPNFHSVHSIRDGPHYRTGAENQRECWVT